jgi:hypothetical protein
MIELLPHGLAWSRFFLGDVAAPLDMGQLWGFLPRGYLITVAIETPVLLVGLSRTHSWSRRVVAGFWLNACSYPIVIIVLPALLGTNSPAYLPVAETFAPVCECTLFALAFHTAALSRRDRIQDLITITLANLASFLGGMWLAHIGWLTL